MAVFGVALNLADAIMNYGLHGSFQVASTRYCEFEALAADLRLQFVGGTSGDDASLIDDGDLVGKLIGLLQVLRGEQDGGSVGDEGADDLPHAETAARV